MHYNWFSADISHSKIMLIAGIQNMNVCVGLNAILSEGRKACNPILEGYNLLTEKIKQEKPHKYFDVVAGADLL